MGPADTECMILIVYHSKLLNHVSKNWEVLTRRKYTDNFDFLISMTRDWVTLNNTLSISYIRCPPATGPIGNAEIVESLLYIDHELRYENRQIRRVFQNYTNVRSWHRHKMTLGQNDPYRYNTNISGGWISIAITKPKQISKSIW